MTRPRPWAGPRSLVSVQGSVALDGMTDRHMPYGPGGGRQPSVLGPFRVSGVTG